MSCLRKVYRIKDYSLIMGQPGLGSLSSELSINGKQAAIGALPFSVGRMALSLTTAQKKDGSVLL